MPQPAEEFHSEQEAALYRMLRAALQNHITTHRLGYTQVLGACIPVLAFILHVMVDHPMADHPEEAPALIRRTLSDLTQRVRRCAARPPALHIQDVPGASGLSPGVETVGNALATLLNEYAAAHALSIASAWRAFNAVMAAVLSVPIHTGESTLEETEQAMERLPEAIAESLRDWEAHLQPDRPPHHPE